MPIQLPNLDNKRFDDLMKEIIASIPKYTKEWTNFNPSDVGITILELLAWVAETLIYRTNRIPEESYWNFLRLIAGASYDDKGNLQYTGYDATDKAYLKIINYLRDLENTKKDTQSMKAKAQEFLTSRYRAITEQDLKKLPKEASANVKRVEVFIKPYHIEIIIIPECSVSLEELPDKVEFPQQLKDKIHFDIEKHLLIFKGVMSADEKDILLALSQQITYQKAITSLYQKPNELIKAVKDYLKPRRLIGTVIEVKMAVYTDINLKITFVREKYAAITTPNTQNLINSVKDAVTIYLDSITGGPDRKGWPYGRNLIIYELFQIIEKIDGVKYVDEILESNRPFTIINIPGLINLKEIEIKIKEEQR